MLSMILSHDSGKLTPAHLDHVAIFQFVLCVDLGPVDAHTLLLNQTSGFTAAGCQFAVDHRCHQVGRSPDVTHLTRRPPLAKSEFEIFFRPAGGLIAMKALDELMSKHCLPIPWMK